MTHDRRSLAASEATRILFRAGVAVIADLLIRRKLTPKHCIAGVGCARIIIVTRYRLSTALSVLAKVVHRTNVPIVAILEAYLVDASCDEITEVLRAFVAVAAAYGLAFTEPFETDVKASAGISIVAFFLIVCVLASALR